MPSRIPFKIRPLPPAITEKNLRLSRQGYWQLDIRIDSERFRVTTKTKNKQNALTIARCKVAEKFNGGTRTRTLPLNHNWEKYIKDLPRNSSSWLYRLWIAEHRKRSMSYDEIEAIALRSQGRCEVSGLQFRINTEPVIRRSPFAPSLDRIEAGGSYSAENCRLVALCINTLMMNWGDKVWNEIIKSLDGSSVLGQHCA